MDRLTNMIKLGFQDSSKLPSYMALWDRLKYYEDLEEQNLIHIAPCPNGVDIFFIEDRDFMDFEKIVSKDSYSFGFTEYCHGEFNKDWFLTHEEADNKLKEMSE